MEKIILFSVTFILLLLSYLKDREKTKIALIMAYKKIIKIGLPILLTIILISILLHFLPKDTVSNILTKGNSLLAMVLAAVVGSIAVLPGFIAFPLGGVLKDSGVPYMVIAAFTSTLMMVGLATLPVEIKYLGIKVAVLRNVAGFCMAIITALVTGILYGELNP